MLESLIAALVSAFCYGIAAVMQAIAVRSASHRPAMQPGESGPGVDPGMLVRMLGQWRFVASIGIDLIGFIAQLVALNRLPLFAVQAIIAANLAVTAVFAAWLMRVRLSLREWLAVSGVVVGVGLLGSSAGAEGASRVGFAFKLGLIVAVAGVAVAGVVAARLPDAYRTVVVGAIAGLGYGVLAVSARILPGFSPAQLVKDPATYTLAAAGIVSFMLYATALEGGSVTVATAAVVLCETTPPALVGVLLLGDSTRHGLAGVAVLGFVLAVFCAVALARFGEASEGKAAEAAGAAAAKAGKTAKAGKPAGSGEGKAAEATDAAGRVRARPEPGDLIS